VDLKWRGARCLVVGGVWRPDRTALPAIACEPWALDLVATGRGCLGDFAVGGVGGR
jgi:hypothetical protein